MKFTIKDRPNNEPKYEADLRVDSSGQLELVINGNLVLYIRQDGMVRLRTMSDFVDGGKIRGDL